MSSSDAEREKETGNREMNRFVWIREPAGPRRQSGWHFRIFPMTERSIEELVTNAERKHLRVNGANLSFCYKAPLSHLTACENASIP